MRGGSGIYRVFSIVFILALFALIFGYLMVDVWDPDFWWHLATGKWIVEHGRLPDKDPFSYATLQKDPYTPINRVRFILTQYWLAQSLLYKVYSLYGFSGVSFMRALILTLTVAMLYPLLRLYRISRIIILPLIATSAYLMKSFSGERPQLFSFLFATIVIYLLEGMSKRLEPQSPPENMSPGFPVHHILLVLCMPLWANLHGGFIYGVIVILIYLTSHWFRFIITRRREAIELRPYVGFTVTAIPAVLLTLLNPNAYYSLIDHFRYKPLIYLMYIQEFTPTFRLFHTNKGYFVLLILLTLLILVEIIKRSRLNISHLFLFLFNAFISLTAVRFVPFFLISGSFLIGVYLDKIIRLDIFKKRKGLEAIAIIMVCLCIVGVGYISGLVSKNELYLAGVQYNLYPYAAADFLKTLPPRRIFNPYTWGGYLIWDLYPRYKVFIDGRGLNQEIFLQYMEVIRVDRSEEYAGRPKWKAILDSYDIDYVLIAPFHKFSEGIDLTYALAEDEDWRLIYADDIALVFIRNNKEFEKLIKRYSLSEDIVYAVAAGQALQRANSATIEKKKLHAYLTAVDAFIRLDKMENAKYALREAFKIDPEDENVKAWIEALSLKKEFKQ